MTLNTILNPLIKEDSQPNPKWVFPSRQALQQEYEVEYKRHIVHELGNIFPTFEDFLRACKHGHPMVITSKLDDRIWNRSRTDSYQELLNLISGYRSYPEFRNEGTLKNLYSRIKSSQELDMPILLIKKSRIRVMSGNTRMDVAFQLGVNPTCLVVEY